MEPLVSGPTRKSVSTFSHPLRFSVDTYYRLAEVGILDPDTRYELIGGVIYELKPIDPRHATRLKKLETQLEACLRSAAIVFLQHPLLIPEDHEPQPDILVVKPPIECYEARHLLPEDVLLVIEVVDTTVQSDRTVKLELYARAGIPEYWIVNLSKSQLEIYLDPDTLEGRYREMRTLDAGDPATPNGTGNGQGAWWRSSMPNTPIAERSSSL